MRLLIYFPSSLFAACAFESKWKIFSRKLPLKKKIDETEKQLDNGSLLLLQHRQAALNRVKSSIDGNQLEFHWHLDPWWFYHIHFIFLRTICDLGFSKGKRTKFNHSWEHVRFGYSNTLRIVPTKISLSLLITLKNLPQIPKRTDPTHLAIQKTCISDKVSFHSLLGYWTRQKTIIIGSFTTNTVFISLSLFYFFSKDPRSGHGVVTIFVIFFAMLISNFIAIEIWMM